MDYQKTVGIILDLLRSNHFWFESFEHEEVRTSEEAARMRPEYRLDQGAKALIIKAYLNDGTDKIFMMVMPANLKLDSKKVCNVVGAKKIRFSTEEEVSQVTEGVKVGGVPPFGNLFGLETIIDPRLFDNDRIVFNAGDRRFSIAMNSADYKRIANARVESIT